jgi:two-component system CheB/CheR fusion protein
MASPDPQLESLIKENAELRSKYEEASETLDAIRSGHVDALLIGEQLYTLESSDAASNRFRGEALSQINDSVIAVDLERHLTYINPAAERQYGVHGSEVLGHLVEGLVTLRWRDEGEAATVISQLEKTGSWRGETVHIRRDGTEFYAESTVSVLHDSSGNASGHLSIIRDITDRKRAEDELRRAHDELEARVEERTHELAQTNLALKGEVEARNRTEVHRTQLLQRIVTSQEDERRRIARDIHDQLGQRVTALRLQLASLGEGDESDLNEQIELLKQTTERLDSDIGFLSYELRPASLDDIGLPDTARAFVKDWSENFQIDAEFSVRGFVQRRLRTDAETHLYRIMQEALNNIAKHAAASNVSVILGWEDNAVLLIIEDDGCGFDLGSVDEQSNGSRGLGLLHIRERAILLGGTVEIESSANAGTTIYVRVPA